MSVRRWQFHISHLTPLLESWLTDKAPAKPSLKLNEPYIIWDRLRLALSHAGLVLCFSRVKHCERKGGRGGADINLYSPAAGIEILSVTDWADLEPASLVAKRAEWTPSGTLDLHASVRPTGGSSPASANSELRLNVIHPLLLRWDFSSSTSQSHPAGTRSLEFPFS